MVTVKPNRVSTGVFILALASLTAACTHVGTYKRFAKDASTPTNQGILIRRNDAIPDRCEAFPDKPDAPHVSHSMKHHITWVLVGEPDGTQLEIEFDAGPVVPFKNVDCHQGDICRSGKIEMAAAPKHSGDKAFEYHYSCKITPPTESGKPVAKSDPTVMVDF